ncbi:HAD family hydrolase [Bosea sp. FBZP-16]|uniref:HAD family hydrolase n=1 Tax=Bosea sp. FBZP-16 TaxID=2065382 RepID=UPI000C31B3F7|nr:HAD family hydrolase [Bosea sp. FBZP-16]
MSLTRRFALAALSATLLPAPAALAQPDPLPSWNQGLGKHTLLAFIARVTREGGPDYVPPAERIAVFDNDGTLWAEQPSYFQFQFALDRTKALAPQNPAWQDRPAFRAIVAGDAKALSALSHKDVQEILAISHAGMTTEAFARTVAEWLATARHPRFGQPYDQLVYQPQLELLAHLRASGFKTFIVSGGGVEFIRVFAEKAYGVPPEQVVGSSVVVKLQMATDGKAELVKQAQVEFVDDGPGKPVGINRFIGRRPIIAFGNSDGDHQMLQWTAAGSGPRLMAILHHTDAIREWAYDRTSQIGRLDKALDEANDRGWTVIDMRRDWKWVFPFQRQVP